MVEEGETDRSVEQNRSPEINPHKHGLLISDTGTKAAEGGEGSVRLAMGPPDPHVRDARPDTDLTPFPGGKKHLRMDHSPEPKAKR